MRPYALALLLCGCGPLAPATVKDDLIQQISFQRNCPKEAIRVLEMSPTVTGAKADVCGAHRTYVLAGRGWVEVAD